jgi:hypothetical protein
MLKNYFFCLLFLLTGLFIFGQQKQNFDNYKTLISKGTMPSDFSTLSYEKIENDIVSSRTELKGKKEKVFLEGIHYSIDKLLHSGLVVYGDEVSDYVSKLVDHLLKDNPTLRKELRFYTLKSSSTNAFSTDQGIIFVTTGLISQLTSEAQLAYVLAHEISHYTEKHVVDGFVWKQKNIGYKSKIENFSNYSKEKEFEADRLGVQMYYKAGYSKSQIDPTFDVLMYSYLPFDEIEFPVDYFNSDLLYIPLNNFPTSKYPIKAEEDFDDSKHSHPNIKKRKGAASKEVEKYQDWGNKISILGESEFNYIQTICRFEDVRSNVLDAKYADAFYSIFILEKEHPNSIYLKRMKAKVWLNLAYYKEEGKLNKMLPNSTSYEGEIASLYFMLKSLNKLAFQTVALRQIEDIRKQYPNDKEINAIWDRMVKYVASIEKFELASFSKKNYQTAYQESIQKPVVLVDTLESKEKTSKYDKIKKKKDIEDPSNFDSTNFHFYGISDLLENELFLSSFNKYLKEKQENKDMLAKRKQMKKNDLNKLIEHEKQNRLRIEESNLILVEPMVFRYKGNEIDRVKSEKLEQTFVKSTADIAELLEMNIHVIGSSTANKLGTAGFNEKAVLLNYMGQIMEEKDIDPFPVDYDLLDEIKLNYGTKNVAFSILTHKYDPQISFVRLLALNLFIPPLIIPTLITYVPLKLISGNETNLSVYILDLDAGKLRDKQHMYFKEPLNKITLKGHLYDIYSRIKSPALK